MFALARLSQARHRPEKTAPLAVAAPARMPSPNLFDQRHQSMEQERNFWEAARALARQGLESVLAVPAPSNRQPSVPPSLKVQGGWWRNWRVRRRFHRLWQLAYGTKPVRISSRQLSRLDQEIENMKAVLARSNFAPAPPPIQHPVRETKADSS
jgi:hypothetical protein